MAIRSLIVFSVSVLGGLAVAAGAGRLYDWLTEPTARLDRVDATQAEVATLLLVILIPAATASFNLAAVHRIQAHTRISIILSVVLLVAVAIPLLMILSFTNSCNIDRSFPIPGYKC